MKGGSGLQVGIFLLVCIIICIIIGAVAYGSVCKADEVITDKCYCGFDGDECDVGSTCNASYVCVPSASGVEEEEEEAPDLCLHNNCSGANPRCDVATGECKPPLPVAEFDYGVAGPCQTNDCGEGGTCYPLSETDMKCFCHPGYSKEPGKNGSTDPCSHRNVMDWDSIPDDSKTFVQNEDGIKGYYCNNGFYLDRSNDRPKCSSCPFNTPISVAGTNVGIESCHVSTSLGDIKKDSGGDSVASYTGNCSDEELISKFEDLRVKHMAALEHSHCEDIDSDGCFILKMILHSMDKVRCSGSWTTPSRTSTAGGLWGAALQIGVHGFATEMPDYVCEIPRAYLSVNQKDPDQYYAGTIANDDNDYYIDKIHEWMNDPKEKIDKDFRESFPVTFREHFSSQGHTWTDAGRSPYQSYKVLMGNLNVDPLETGVKCCNVNLGWIKDNDNDKCWGRKKVVEGDEWWDFDVEPTLPCNKHDKISDSNKCIPDENAGEYTDGVECGLFENRKGGKDELYGDADFRDGITIESDDYSTDDIKTLYKTPGFYDQFSFGIIEDGSETPVCKYKSSRSSEDHWIICGNLEDIEAKGWNPNCHDCKPTHKLTFNKEDGFKCIPTKCKRGITEEISDLWPTTADIHDVPTRQLIQSCMLSEDWDKISTYEKSKFNGQTLCNNDTDCTGILQQLNSTYIDSPTDTVKKSHAPGRFDLDVSSGKIKCSLTEEEMAVTDILKDGNKDPAATPAGTAGSTAACRSTGGAGNDAACPLNSDSTGCESPDGCEYTPATGAVTSAGTTSKCLNKYTAIVDSQDSQDVCTNPNPCSNGGTCKPETTGDKFSCTCTAGHIGSLCQIETKELCGAQGSLNSPGNLNKKYDPIGGYIKKEDGTIIPRLSSSLYFVEIGDYTAEEKAAFLSPNQGNEDILNNITPKLDSTYYTCDCGPTRTDRKGKKYGAHNMDPETFCNCPIKGQEETIAVQGHNDSLWEHFFWDNTLSPNKNNSIDRMRCALDCGTNPFTQGLEGSTDQGYKTGNYYYHPHNENPICKPCIGPPNQFFGTNQIKLNKYLGWTESSPATDDPEDSVFNYFRGGGEGEGGSTYQNFKASYADIPSENVGDAHGIDHMFHTFSTNMKESCKPAYPGYYGTLGKFSGGKWVNYGGFGGEKVDSDGTGETDPYPVQSNYIKRKTSVISEFGTDCLPENQMNWTPVKFLASTEDKVEMGMNKCMQYEKVPVVWPANPPGDPGDYSSPATPLNWISPSGSSLISAVVSPKADDQYSGVDIIHGNRGPCSGQAHQDNVALSGAEEDCKLGLDAVDKHFVIWRWSEGVKDDMWDDPETEGVYNTLVDAANSTAKGLIFVDEHEKKWHLEVQTAGRAGDPDNGEPPIVTPDWKKSSGQMIYGIGYNDTENGCLTDCNGEAAAGAVWKECADAGCAGTTATD